ncbi:MAG: putative RNA uridine N3 methyltransferase [Candidatus Odinarchaeota archaeon]
MTPIIPFIKKIAFPECVVANYKNLREKTVVLGTIARACAIFRIEEIFFFKSPFMTAIDREKEHRRVNQILSYIETPQYLRKQLFPIQKELAHVGELPPLATPHHPDRAHSKLKEGDIREGLVTVLDGNVVAYVGSKKPVPVQNPPPVSLKDKELRMTLRVVKNNGEFSSEIVSRKTVSPSYYSGYRIKYLQTSLGRWKDEKYLFVATSRRGIDYKKLQEEELKEKKKESMIIFGSATRGLHEFLRVENRTMEQLGWTCVNTVPNAGVRSVRLEEALLISLARLNDL